MNKYEDLYGMFKQAKEAMQKKNFNAFMTGLESGLVEQKTCAQSHSSTK